LYELNRIAPGETIHFLLVSAAVKPFTEHFARYIATQTSLRVGTVVSVLPLMPQDPELRGRPPLPEAFKFGAWLEINHPMAVALQVVLGANPTSSANAEMQRRIHYVEVAGYGDRHICYNSDRDNLFQAHAEQISWWIEHYAVHWIELSVKGSPDHGAQLFELNRPDIEYKGPKCQ
jgi:hypothetical protein